MKQVLFVCTGNIFRSLTAEYALRHALRDRPGVHVSSAGTADYPYVVRPNVREYLLSKGFDVSRHQRRTLTAALLDAAQQVVPMSTDQRAHHVERFGRSGPLFLEACGGLADAQPAIEEVVLDYRTNSAAVAAHVRSTIDRICGLTPLLAARLDTLLK